MNTIDMPDKISALPHHAEDPWRGTYAPENAPHPMATEYIHAQRAMLRQSAHAQALCLILAVISVTIIMGGLFYTHNAARDITLSRALYIVCTEMADEIKALPAHSKLKQNCN